ncbi:MAG TPA: chemotaxis-specific protein-glutamate methyltransferase CheB, partial [Polyangiaceae bacterium]|nr:chemotaxis-specific protein-glutamate methyltransferase CheB [Polyangiaceae bacterium]
MSPIRVLVVDDSAFARKVLRECLATSPRLEVVGTARDGIDALEKIAELDPDVITLDLVMPNLDGLAVLAALSPEQRGRVVVVSMADSESDLGIAALAAGAFDIVGKPTALAFASLQDISGELVSKVTLAGQRRGARLPALVPVRTPVPRAGTAPKVVVIGTSTGGPQALSRLLKAFPADFPVPIAIVLHIPPGYTGPLAERLNAESPLEVLEASDGLELRPGRVLLARAGIHLKFTKGDPEVSARLDPQPQGGAHRPSVDALFESAAQAFGPRVLAVVLTGMGDDGLAGARAVVAAGGEVLTEAESSCVVYGMPRVVREAGLSSCEVPLERMVA